MCLLLASEIPFYNINVFTVVSVELLYRLYVFTSRERLEVNVV